jgi:hypothetical protein
VAALIVCFAVVVVFVLVRSPHDPDHSAGARGRRRAPRALSRGTLNPGLAIVVPFVDRIATRSTCASRPCPSRRSP